jgi:inositol transport system substrate-binding protein
MTNWLSTGAADGVIANNDDMAIGAIQALKGGHRHGGPWSGRRRRCHAQDALAAMQAGDLDVTVFQNAKAQGGGALDRAEAGRRRSGRPGSMSRSNW